MVVVVAAGKVDANNEVDDDVVVVVAWSGGVLNKRRELLSLYSLDPTLHLSNVLFRYVPIVFSSSDFVFFLLLDKLFLFSCSSSFCLNYI